MSRLDWECQEDHSNHTEHLRNGLCSTKVPSKVVFIVSSGARRILHLACVGALLVFGVFPFCGGFSTSDSNNNASRPNRSALISKVQHATTTT